MRTENYLRNQYYEVLENANGDCFVKDIRRQKYYFKKGYYASKRCTFTHVEKIQWNWKDSLYSVLICFSWIAFVYIALQYCNIYSKQELSWKEYSLLVLFCVINIGIHEFAHAITMHMYHRTYGKIQLKLYYFVFPAFVTDTTDSYLLPRFRRCFVYYAGIMSNLIVCGITLVLFPSSAYLLRIMFWGIIYNMIPFGGMKTDGYHIIVNTLLKKNDIKGKKNLVGEIAKILFFLCVINSLIYSIVRCIIL